MHVFGADLNFDGGAEGAEQHRVQRLVAVGLWQRDVVLEAPGHGFVEAVHRTQHPVACVRRVHQDTKGMHVHDV